MKGTLALSRYQIFSDGLVMKQDIRKPGRNSDLNLCLLPSASQLGIPSELTPDPHQTAYPTLVEDNDQYSALSDNIRAYNHMGGSNVGSFVADTVHSSTTSVHSIDPSHSSFYPTSQPPHVGGSDVGSFIAHTICSSATPMHSINPSFSSLRPTFQPPQWYIRPTPYPPEVGTIRNVCAFGPIRWTEEDHG